MPELMCLGLKRYLGLTFFVYLSLISFQVDLLIYLSYVSLNREKVQIFQFSVVTLDQSSQLLIETLSILFSLLERQSYHAILFNF